MHDRILVGLAEPRRHLQRDVDRLGERQRRALDSHLQGLAFVQRHRDEQLPVGGGADLVDGADIRMIERGRGARLEQETLLGFRLCAQVRRQEFQCDLPAQPFVTRAVHQAHRPRAQRLRH